MNKNDYELIRRLVQSKDYEALKKIRIKHVNKYDLRFILPTPKFPRLIKFLSEFNGWPIKELSFEEMERIDTIHPIENKIRLEAVKKEILDGKEQVPIMLSKDWLCLDGAMRLQARKELHQPIKALLTSWPNEFVGAGICFSGLEGQIW